MNGNIFTGLVRDKMILRLGESDRTKFLALPGATHFVAMGGRRMKEWMVVPSAVSRCGMNTTRRALLVAFAAVVLVAPARAEEARARSYALPDHGTLQLTVPVSWKEEIQQPPNRLPPTILFSQGKGPAFVVYVTPMWPPRPDAPEVTADVLKQLVLSATEMAKPKAVERTLEVKAMKGASGPGYYFSATDRAPARGEFKHMTQGTIRIGAIVADFTILTNDGRDDVVSAAIAMMAAATHTGQ